MLAQIPVVNLNPEMESTMKTPASWKGEHGSFITKDTWDGSFALVTASTIVPDDWDTLTDPEQARVSAMPFLEGFDFMARIVKERAQRDTDSFEIK